MYFDKEDVLHRVVNVETGMHEFETGMHEFKTGTHKFKTEVKADTVEFEIGFSSEH